MSQTAKQATDLRLPPERAGRPAPAEVAARREGMTGAVAAGTWRTTPAPEETSLDGVRVLRFRPSGPARGLVLHLHGGGFRLGCPEMIGPYAAALAARCGVEVVCPTYRLAPEHPFPAGLNDAHTVYRALRREGARPLIVSGDSAGGGLAASLTALAAGEGAAPAGLILLSAWLDLTVSAGSYWTNAATDPLFSQESAETAADLYLQGHASSDPLASPLFATLEGFPPTLVSLGEGEVLADDARKFHAALQAAGVAAQLQTVAGMEHVAVTRGLTLTGAAETFERVAGFVDGLTQAG
ncbi:alpha/beta hydrolase fold domain-containing protein [Phenylobacterium sp. LjRoot219]|uniref:alpha/beta hydrolase fold domain-containing protein n=1 Tax=Phenylobacterium sp. LjRoot219 TaxID=3342283 RepID=UPI003ECDD7C8